MVSFFLVLRKFHVWCEAWLKRKDLRAGFGGWQVVDATPRGVGSAQLKTGGIGPAPVKAIRDGLSIGYDTNYVMSEVRRKIRHNFFSLLILSLCMLTQTHRH